MRSIACIAILVAGVALTGCAASREEPLASDGAPAGTTSPRQGQSQVADAPLTEQDYEQLMEKVGPAFQSLRKSLQGNSLDPAADQARQLAELFGEVERFWEQHKVQDAVRLASLARTHATNAAGAAAAGEGGKARTATDSLGGACKQCHTAYRVETAEGDYRIKEGVLK